MKWKPVAVNGFLALVGILFSLGAGEIIIRAVKAAPEVVYIEKWRMRLSSNPKIGYEPIPRFDGRGKSVTEFGHPGVGNSLGFRDREREIKKSRV